MPAELPVLHQDAPGQSRREERGRQLQPGHEGCGAAVLRAQEQPLLGAGSGRQQEVSRAAGAG